MVPAAAIDCIDRLLKDIMKCETPINGQLPMGGKIVLFGGDFRQVLPVVPCKERFKYWKHAYKTVKPGGS